MPVRLRRLLREIALTAGAAVGVLCIGLSLAGWVFGVHLMVFRSGSMSPTIKAGGAALVHHVAAADVRVRDIVSVRGSDGVRITHRVQTIERAGETATLTLKGDANSAPDEHPYVVSSVDRVFWHANRLGFVAHAFASRVALMIAGAAAVGLLFLGFSGGSGGSGGSDAPRRHRGGAGEQRRPRSKGGSRRADGKVRAGTLAVTVVSLSLVVAAPAMASWADTATMTSGSISSATLPPPTAMTCSGAGLLVTPTLSWTAPVSTPTPTQYVVTYRAGSATAAGTSVTVTGTSWKMPNSLLSLFTTYYISVRSAVAGTAWTSVSANPGQKVTVTSVLVNAITSCAGTFTPAS